MSVSFEEEGAERAEAIRLAASRLERAGKALRSAIRTGAVSLPPSAEARALAASIEAERAVADLLKSVREVAYADPADYWFDAAREELPDAGYRLIADRAHQLARHASESLIRN